MLLVVYISPVEFKILREGEEEWEVTDMVVDGGDAAEEGLPLVGRGGRAAAHGGEPAAAAAASGGAGAAGPAEIAAARVAMGVRHVPSQDRYIVTGLD